MRSCAGWGDCELAGDDAAVSGGGVIPKVRGDRSTVKAVTLADGKVKNGIESATLAYEQVEDGRTVTRKSRG
nr:hypothetical protein [Nostoc sp. EkiNYC01]